MTPFYIHAAGYRFESRSTGVNFRSGSSEFDLSTAYGKAFVKKALRDSRTDKFTMAKIFRTAYQQGTVRELDAIIYNLNQNQSESSRGRPGNDTFRLDQDEIMLLRADLIGVTLDLQGVTFFRITKTARTAPADPLVMDDRTARNSILDWVLLAFLPKDVTGVVRDYDSEKQYAIIPENAAFIRAVLDDTDVSFKRKIIESAICQGRERHLNSLFQSMLSVSMPLNLIGVDLSGLDLRNFNFSNAILRNANLSESNLSGVNLESADLEGANLTATDLTGAQLNKTNLRHVDLTATKVSDENLVNAYRHERTYRM